ncbi:MAG: hypothetical protein B7Z20_08015 [Sphingobium sp. 32-64-5]|nr:MAG: hypothetical protein B7Z20_08015 [Sphingobium sp. 32-64-5]
MEKTDRALARTIRFAQFAQSVSFRTGAGQNNEVVARFEQLRKANPAYAKRLAENRKKAVATAGAYRTNGADLYVDRYVRDFLAEYNSRVLRGEGVNMPSSFNVMRSFVDPDDEALILKLLPERVYSVTMNRLLDHVTDPSIEGPLQHLLTDLEELTIYEINMLGGVSDFSILGHEDFVFCGCAFVREGNELSLMGVFGRKNPQRQVSKTSTAGAAVDGKEFLFEGRDEIDTSDHALFGDERFQPVILMVRIDLANATTQARYVFEEKVESFIIASDDPDTLEFLRSVPDGEKRIAQGLEGVAKHADLFALLAKMPSFCGRALERLEDDFVLERRPTKIRLERDKPSVRRALERLAPSDKPAFVDVLTLYELTPDTTRFEMKNAGLVVETSGFWKTLPLGTAGKDKAGRPVQGKTWVHEQSSWFQSKIAQMEEGAASIDVTVSVSGNERAGEIYVVRSALHPKHVYKIGFTTKSSTERADQLAATSGQPDMFNVIQSWRVRNPREIEHQVHGLLSEFRINQSREFFKLEYWKIREAIEKVIDQNEAVVTD